MPVAGRDGTLAGRMKGTPAEGNVRAKTGTMSNIRTLAGYVRTRDGETLAFAILADNFEGSGAAATDAIDRIAVRLATSAARATASPSRASIDSISVRAAEAISCAGRSEAASLRQPGLAAASPAEAAA